MDNAELNKKIKLAKHYNRGLFGMTSVISKKDGMYEWRVLFHEQLVARGMRRWKADAQKSAREAIKDASKRFHKSVENMVEQAVGQAQENGNV